MKGLRRGQPSPSKDVFFLTGTDEHADKVVTSGAQHGMTPLQWADRNAAEFQKAFAFMGFSHDDFIRTDPGASQVQGHRVRPRLQASGDVYLGDYVGWYDESQDEYLTETVAKDSPQGPYTSPVTGKPLVKRTEKNYFFKLSKYEARLREAHRRIPARPGASSFSPYARQNEVLGKASWDGVAGRADQLCRGSGSRKPVGHPDARRSVAPDLRVDRCAVQLPYPRWITTTADDSGHPRTT